MDEDNLIENFLQNKYHATMQTDGLKEEPLGKSQDSSWEYLIIVGSYQINVKIAEINPSRNLNTSHFLSDD